MSKEEMKLEYQRNIQLALGLFNLESWKQGGESQLRIDILWQIVHIHLQRQDEQREFVLKIFWGLIAISLKHTNQIEREE